MEFLKHIYKRWKQPMNKFWKNVQKLCIIFGSLGSMIGAAGAYYSFLPEWVLPVFATAGLVGTFLSQLTVADINKI